MYEKLTDEDTLGVADKLKSCLTDGDFYGFDFNRELHLIRNLKSDPPKVRRLVLKLHYVVYPKGWEWVGR